MPRRPVIGGNWKCNPATRDELATLIETVNKCETTHCDVYVCPSPLHVASCLVRITNDVKICPQNCNFTGTGAYTGEMAVEQMSDMGIDWVLLGHSERREYFSETDTVLATKCKYALEKGFKVVYCIGEKLDVREQGLEAIMAVIQSQLEQVKGMLDADKMVIAYEPVWAIGTGVTASPEQAQETHAAIRQWIADNVSADVAAAIRIQYGGSAKAANAPELYACPDIDGFLVGGASLKPEFADMVKILADAFIAKTP